MPDSVIDIKSTAEMDELLKKSGGLVVVHFWASWAPQCQQVTDVIKELVKSHSSTVFTQVEAEAVPEVSMKYEIAAVPTCVLIKNNKVVSRINGANVPELTAGVSKYSGEPIKPKPSTEEDLNARLKTLINASPVVLFMKGNKDQPRCGFSRQMVDILGEQKVDFTTFDILQDDAVRQGLKKYSDWPTYPQLYADGQLLGGLDIVKELVASGELQSQLPSKKGGLEEQLSGLVKRHHIMVFMKGSPEAPQCGFSRTLISILDEVGEPYDHFDILQDNEVRQGLKTFSNWPTYPQLYVDGELIGGLDIIKEMVESGELADTLKQSE